MEELLKTLIPSTGVAGVGAYAVYLYIKKIMCDQQKQLDKIEQNHRDCKIHCDGKINLHQNELIQLKIDFMESLNSINLTLAKIEAREDVMEKLKSLLKKD